MKIHIVQKGDTLWDIAQHYDVDFTQLQEINSHISSPDMLMPGMKVKIPSSTKQVKQGNKETKTPPKSTKIIEDDHKEYKEIKQTMPTLPNMPVLPNVSPMMNEEKYEKNYKPLKDKKETKEPKKSVKDKQEDMSEKPFMHSMKQMPMSNYQMPIMPVYYVIPPCCCMMKNYPPNINDCYENHHMHHEYQQMWGNMEPQYEGHKPGYYYMNEYDHKSPSYNDPMMGQPELYPPFYHHRPAHPHMPSPPNFSEMPTKESNKDE